MSESSPKDAAKSSSPLAAFRDPAQASLGNNASSLLRRRREPASALTAASKALGQLADLTKKVRLDAIASHLETVINGDAKKRQISALPAAAPIGVTHAYSVLVTHVVAPLWSVAAPSVGVHPPIVFNDTFTLNFARMLDSKGWDVETVCDSLNSDPLYATVYICFLLAKLLCLENQEWRMSFTELATQISRDVRPKKDYEEHRNDENTTHDQPRRKLTEVGGVWRPRGAVELAPALAQLRQLCITRCMQVSVAFKYIYTDENLQSLVDALSSQLFLVNYSESVVQLVAGIKGENYVAKYFLHAARSSSEIIDADSNLCEAEVRTPALEAVTACVELALSNLIHRNDTYEVVIHALTKALGMCPPRQARSLIQITKETLSLTYCADLAMLAALLDAVRPLVLQPNPVGREAHELMTVVWHCIRCVGSPSRALLASLFVAGEDLRSFRRRPAHLFVTPYSARAFLLTKTSHGEIPMQRGANPMLPVALPANIDPATGASLSVLLDDTVLYIANHVSNVFQQALELTSYEAEALAEDDTAEARQADTQGRDRAGSAQSGTLTDAISRCQLVDLGHLFSIPPMNLCASMPMMQMLLHPSKGTTFSDPKHTKPETLITIAEQYAVVAAAHKPTKGQRRFRLESPRPPLRPLLVSVATETDDPMVTLKGILNNHWKYCDARITDKEPAYMHPKRDLSLSHFIENDIDLVVVGGTGTVRRLVETIVRLRIDFPGAVPTIRIYLLPAGYDNDVAAWLARSDALYNQRIFAPFACLPTISVDTLPPDALTAPPSPTFESLTHRNMVAHFLNHGKAVNDLVLYQVECVSADGSVHYVAMCANFEIGAHVTAAVYRDNFSMSKEGLATEPFAIKDLTRSADMRSMRRGKSSLGLTRQGSDALSAASLAAITLTRDHLIKIMPLADNMVKQFSVMQTVAISSSEGENAFTDRLESCDRILARMHSSYRGIPLSTRRHPLESRDIPFCCSGTDLLDWISTSYHTYDSKVALKTASRMLERGLIMCAAAASGKTADKFSEANLYVLRPREEADTVPLAVASSRSRTYDMAMSMRESVQEAPIPRPGAGQSTVAFVMKAKILFTPRRGDPQYVELGGTSSVGTASAIGGAEGNPNAGQRTLATEVVTLKLKSTGASGDKGHAPNPCVPCLQLCVHDAERKRFVSSVNPASVAGPASPGANNAPGSPGGAGANAAGSAAGAANAASAAAAVKPSNTGASPDTGDYFTVRFGDEKTVDPKCVLAIDVVDDGVIGPAGLSIHHGIVGVHCCIDGDLFGPFVGFRIKPIVGKEKDTAMTVPFMSYTKCDTE